MIRRKVRVPHGRFQVLVTKYSLQGQDVAAVDHKVACEGMAQHVGELP